MQQIWKYLIPVKDEFSVDMPEGATILAVQMQRNEPHIWALVYPANHSETRRFRVFGTGQPIDDHNLSYIGTFQILGGDLVFHLFEDYNDPPEMEAIFMEVPVHKLVGQEA